MTKEEKIKELENIIEKTKINQIENFSIFEQIDFRRRIIEKLLEYNILEK